MSEKKTPQASAGKSHILAKRYAIALLELAEERGVTDVIVADLSVLEEVALCDPSFTFLANRPQLRTHVLRAIVKEAAEKAKLHPLTSAFLDCVAARRRLAFLGPMILSLRAELAERRKNVMAYVTAPQTLTEAQQKAIIANLSKTIGGTVNVIVKEDPALLGGLVIRIGSQLIDASVKGKLAQIERNLKTQQEAA